jgi:hypothetical protein
MQYKKKWQARDDYITCTISSTVCPSIHALYFSFPLGMTFGTLLDILDYPLVCAAILRCKNFRLSIYA